MSMALEPEWIKDMVMTIGRMIIMHLEELFYRGGASPDALFFHDDLGFKFRPFMSAEMYREVIYPGHKLLFDYSHSIGCPVIFHSCGYMEPIVPALIDAGMDCLQTIEVKAGMDMKKLFDDFGDKISFYGGLDSRALEANDRQWINNELEKMEYILKNNGSYILQTDHSEPPGTDYETLLYFLDKSIKSSKNILK